MHDQGMRPRTEGHVARSQPQGQPGGDRAGAIEGDEGVGRQAEAVDVARRGMDGEALPQPLQRREGRQRHHLHGAVLHHVQGLAQPGLADQRRAIRGARQQPQRDGRPPAGGRCR